MTRPRHTQLLRPPLRHRSAFTLVEVMISVALVLFLIIGVNQVFKMTADTVGAGQRMSANVRDNRAAQGVLFNDLNNAVTQSPPIFWIASSRTSAFRNRADRESAKAFATGGTEVDIRKIDLNDNGIEGEPPATIVGEQISPATYNFRSHRTDRMGFFARGIFQRQTGNDGTFASPTRSEEAYIWYGHLKLHDNSQAYADVNFRPPGNLPTENIATNPNNLDAASFALGRNVILMRDPNDGNFPAEVHYPRLPPVPPPSSGTPVDYNLNLRPFTFDAPPSNGDANARIQTSRYDLAGITIAQFTQDTTERSLGSSRNGSLPAEPQWWQGFLYQGSYIALTGPHPAAEDFRYHADRFFARPLDAEKASRMAPILLSGCSQFIVEFAGDFVTQENDATNANYGDVTSGSGPDGITDFVVAVVGGVNVRSTRWYGMPRDVAGDPNKGGPDGHVFRGNAANPSVDVVPLRDVRGAASAFERYVDQQLLPPTGAGGDYLDPAAGMAPDARYDCVWGPDLFASTNPLIVTNNPLPQMLRITFVLDDPTGRLAEGQVYEYVITLPH
jgi:type II secretory pathway pseudopilin PulG